MTHNPLMSRERVVVPDRPAPTKAQKVAAWNRENGLCVLCLKPVAQAGPGVQYDHRDPREISCDDSEGNLFATHTDCHARKTAKVDAPRIAKMRRQEKLTMAKVRKRSGLSHPTLKRTMDGRVVSR